MNGRALAWTVQDPVFDLRCPEKHFQSFIISIERATFCISIVDPATHLLILVAVTMSIFLKIFYV